MRRISYLHKSMVISSVNIVLIAFILTLVSYYIQGKVILKNIQEQSSFYTSLAFDLLDHSTIEEANKIYELNSPSQKKLTALLTYITNKNPDIGQAYIFSTDLKNKSYTKVIAMPQKLIDSENGKLLPGMEYKQPQEVVEAIKLLNVKKKMIKTGVYTDPYGTWVTVLYPILNQKNEVFAYFGIDMDASIIKKAQNDLLLISLFLTSLTLILVLTIQYLIMNKILMPIKDIFFAINQVSQGVGDFQLKEDRKGDIGDVNKKFNHLLNIITLAENYKQLLDENKKQLSQIQEQNKQLISYSKQVEQMTLIEERTRIARELHDTIGHRLTSIIMGLEVIKKVMNHNIYEAENKINNLSQLSKDSLEEVRKSVKILSILDVEDHSLSSNFNKIIEEFQFATEVQVQFNRMGNEIHLLDQIRMVLIRCLQESLTNSVKHGNASFIIVNLLYTDQHVLLEVIDNGAGKATIDFGFGLNSMKTRLEAYNGKFEIKRNNDSGVTVSCFVPIQGTLSDTKIRILIVDDQELIRESLSILLEFEKDFTIVGSAANGEDAIDICKKQEPNIILLDIQLPKLSGIDVLKRLKKEMPAIKIIILTTFLSLEYAKEVITHGAEGYLLKTISPMQLASSIRLVYKGGTLLSQNLAQSLVVSSENGSNTKEHKENFNFEEHELTKREIEILHYLVEGLTYSEIAEEINLAKGTVKNYISTIYSKLNVENRTQALKKILG